MRPLLLLAAFAVLAGGCDLIERPPIERFFGAPYVILEDTLPGGASSVAQRTPYLDPDGLLYLTVSYNGGCGDHRFRMEIDLLDTSATLWLVHADNGDTCSGETIEPMVLQLPEAVLERPLIILASPSGNEVVLRDAPVVPPSAP